MIARDREEQKLTADKRGSERQNLTTEARRRGEKESRSDGVIEKRERRHGVTEKRELSELQSPKR